MIPDGMIYRAVKTITYNNVVAYNVGDLVHESAVDGPDGWLAVGVDVEPVAATFAPVPPRNASQGTWAAFVTSRGLLDKDTALGMSRAQLVDAYDHDQTEIAVPKAAVAAAKDAPAGG